MPLIPEQIPPAWHSVKEPWGDQVKTQILFLRLFRDAESLPYSIIAKDANFWPANHSYLVIKKDTGELIREEPWSFEEAYSFLKSALII